MRAGGTVIPSKNLSKADLSLGPSGAFGSAGAALLSGAPCAAGEVRTVHVSDFLKKK
jgi:hypothetical protein